MSGASKRPPWVATYRANQSILGDGLFAGIFRELIITAKVAAPAGTLPLPAGRSILEGNELFAGISRELIKAVARHAVDQPPPTGAPASAAPPTAKLRERTLLDALVALLAVQKCCTGTPCSQCASALRNARDLVNAGAGAQGGH